MKYILMDRIISHLYLLNFIKNQYQTILCYQSVVFIVVAKTGNNHKRLQTTTNHQQTTINHHKRLENNHKSPPNDYKLPSNKL